MERRTVIKGVAGIGAASAAGVTGLVAMSGGAAAAVGDHQLNAETIEGGTHSGEIDDIAVWLESVEFSYEGLQNAADEVEIDLELTYSGENTLDGNDATQSIIPGDPPTFTTEEAEFEGGHEESPVEFTDLGDQDVRGQVISEFNGLDASDFEPESDGETVSIDDLSLEVIVNIYSGNDLQVSAESGQDEFAVTIHDIPSAGSSGGDSAGELEGSEVDNDYNGN